MMKRYLDGDERSLAELYRRLRPLLRAAIERRLFDRSRVDDVLQSTFLRAHLSRDRFRWDPRHSDHTVVRWYGAIARHSALDEARRGQRRARRVQHVVHQATAIGDGGFGLRTRTLHPEDELVEVEWQAARDARVRRAVATLPPAQREAIELHRLEDRSAEEVAARLQVRPVTVRVRAHRAQQRLAETLRPLAA